MRTLSPPGDSLHVTAAKTVHITVYDAEWKHRGDADEDLQLDLPHGFYRIHFERGGAVTRQLVEHCAPTRIDHPHDDPAMQSPVPFLGAATSHPYYIAAAAELSRRTPSVAIGRGAQTARLCVLIRRAQRDGAAQLPGERVSILALDGRPLDTIAADTALIHPDGYAAYTARVAPGTYRLRAHRSHREVAITIPAGRAAQVFIADMGTEDGGPVRLDELRIALVHDGAEFIADSPLWEVMEVVLAALRSPGHPLPRAAHALLPRADDDLCFALAAACVLSHTRTPTAEDRAALAALLSLLAGYSEIPDVAILGRLHGDTTAAIPDAPPLLRDSLLALMHSPEMTREISPIGAAARAAETLLRDSVWCTWSSRAADKRYIRPAVEAAAAENPGSDAAAIAHQLALPELAVAHALNAVAARTAIVDGKPIAPGMIIAGYELVSWLGHGLHSTVFRARQPDGGEVALKVVPMTGGDIQCARVVDALKRSERRGHRHVITPKDFGALPGGGGIWLAMELCRGSVLDQLANSDMPLPERAARSAMLDALAGLDHLHQREIAHGAIKPPNLLVRSDDSVALADPRLTTAWLLAKGNAGIPVRPRFAAPEELSEGGQPQLVSDVWSITATIYFLLTLELPRDEYAWQTHREAARDNPIIAIRDRHPGVAADIADVLDAALSRDVHLRPRNADALRGNLLHQNSQLGPAAKLLHRFCFDEIEFDPRRPIYEPRGSCRCDHGCGAVWIATKTGDVMRLAPSPEPQVAWFLGQQEARTVYHQHHGDALGLGPVLLIGRDDGTLDIVPNDSPDWTCDPLHAEPGKPFASFQLDAWWQQRHERPVIPVSRSMLRDADLTEGEYAHGVTAITVLPGPAANALTILVATRNPWLYVIDAQDGALHLRNRLELPNWVSWLLRPFEIADAAQPPSTNAICVRAVSRGGDIVRMTRGDLDATTAPDGPRLPSGITAALAFDRGVLVGTAKGLLLVDPAHPFGVAIPVTRSAVLCLDRAALAVDGKPRDYVTIGTDDGHLRVLESEVIRCHAASLPVDSDLHNFPVALDTAVLAVQIARPAGPRAVAFVMAAVREQPPHRAVRLFHVTNLQDAQRDAREEWKAHVIRWFAHDASGPTLAEELAAARLSPPGNASAWKYLLIAVALPGLRARAPLGRAGEDDVVALACELARGGDAVVLHGLSDALGGLSGGRIDLLLALSRGIIGALPAGGDRAVGIIEHHLRELHALTSTVHGADRARLVAWTRFVRKYVLLGPSFSEKEIGLVELVEQNWRTTKYLDALIYQARLAHRGYDLRWESEVGDEIARLHVVTPAGDRTVVIAITATGGVAVFDGASGERERVDRDNRPLEVFAPFAGDGRQVQLRASAATCDGSTIRVVLGCTGDDAPGCGLAIVELRRSGAGTLRVDADTSVVCLNPPRAGRVRVTALEALPGHTDAFVVGLETIGRPIGLLRRQINSWTLELAGEAAKAAHGDDDGKGDGDEAGLAVERVSATRALAVAALEHDPSFLMVAGSDDGVVRAVSFRLDDAPATWQVKRWDRAADAITSIALAPRRGSSGSWAADDTLFYCYVGTTEGDAFALAILDRDASDGTAVSPFGPYMAQPLWREVHDDPLFAMQLWNTPLYEPSEVLITITERGRLCVHNHVARHGGFSSSANYYFRGMRFDGVTLPDRIRAVALIDGDRELVAAGPRGRLYRARLVGLRDSVDRDKAEVCREERHGDLSRTTGAPPSEMWARMHHLLAASQHDEYLHDGPVSDAIRYERKLDLCGLIRLGGGALATYALRKRLLGQPLPTRAGDLHDDMRRELHRLDPRTPAGVDQVKVVIRLMCRALLYDDLDVLRNEIVSTAHYTPRDVARTQAVCEVVSRYVTHDLAVPGLAAIELRTSALKELLRVPTLLHMAVNEECARLVTAAIDSCLVDDDRIVRTEALRALSVVLRNVCIMLEVPGYLGDRGRLAAALFPRGLGSLSWLLDRLVAGLQRFPSYTRRSPLVSGAWPQISVLIMVFRMFPDRTLALCEHLLRAGLDVEVLALCYRSLRRPRLAKLRSRIEYMYLLALLERRDARDAFIARYTLDTPRHREMVKAMELEPKFAPIGDRAWYDVDDAHMAGRLILVLDALARMWNVRTRDAIAAIADPAPPPPPPRGAPELTRLARAPRSALLAPRPLAVTEQVVDKLQQIAVRLADEDKGETLDALDRLVDLGNELSETDPARTALVSLARPIRSIVRRILAEWKALFDTEVFVAIPAAEGMVISGHTLGQRLVPGQNSDIFVLDDDHVIKILRDPSDPGVVREFLDAARRGMRLSHTSEGASIVKITEVLEQRQRPAYVMERYDDDLENYLGTDFHLGENAVPWALLVAERIDAALEAIHRDVAELRRYHGNVIPSNILVRGTNTGKLEVALCDFDRLADPKAQLLPGDLGGKYPGDLDDLRRQQWIDVAALALIVYRMLTGHVLGPRGSADLHVHQAHVDRLALDPRMKSAGAQRIVATLRTLFTPDTPRIEAGALSGRAAHTASPV